MVRKHRVGLIRGDGIGPEVVDAALYVLNGLGINMEFIEVKAGYEYFKKSGKPIEDYWLDTLKDVDVILKGPITTPLDVPNFKSVNVMLRRELDLYANVRPFKSFKGISLKDLNLVLIRENTEDLYVGTELLHHNVAVALKVISEKATERISKFALEYALRNGYKKVTIVHKSNILRATDGLFRNVFFRVAKNYSGLEVNEVLVDSAAYQLVKNPQVFEVMVTENLYGDILADLLAGIIGSLGLCGSAEIGDRYALFEPVHGSAPDIAGKGIANPIGEIVSAKLMLKYLADKYGDSRLARIAEALEKAVRSVVEERYVLTPELGGTASTSKVAKEVLKKANENLSDLLEFQH